MKRIEAREYAMRLVFALCENSDETAEELLSKMKSPEYISSLESEDELYTAEMDDDSAAYIERVVTGVSEHAPEIDGYIEKHLKNRVFSRISGTALAVLRVAVFEIIYMRREVPPKAAINAALDLIRLYDEEATVKFVNGILGAVSKNELPEE